MQERVSFFAVCLMGLLFCLTPVQVTHAQSAELIAGYEKYGELYSQGRYQEVTPFAEEFVRLVEKEFGAEHEHFAEGLGILAFLYNNQGRYAEAEPLYQRSLAIDEKALGPDHPRVAANLNNLALFYNNQGTTPKRSTG